MADTPDFTNWKKRLAELAGDREIWADPNLEDTEVNIITSASSTAMKWLLRVWLVTHNVLHNHKESSYNAVIDASDSDPIDVDDMVSRIVDVQEIAYRQADHQNELPIKGPFVNVPKKPTVTNHKSDKLAEWIARQSAASKMREWADGMREDVRWQVVQAIRENLSSQQLAKRLEERWDHYGQHFQMIAVTEMSMAYNDAVLTRLADSYVTIPTISDDKVCASCHKLLEGKVFWVSPVPVSRANQQENEQYVWVGKSNVGRKSKDWISCVPLHPNCRHVYVKYRGGDPYSYRAVPRGR